MASAGGTVLAVSRLSYSVPCGSGIWLKCEAWLRLCARAAVADVAGDGGDGGGGGEGGPLPVVRCADVHGTGCCGRASKYLCDCFCIGGGEGCRGNGSGGDGGRKCGAGGGGDGARDAGTLGERSEDAACESLLLLLLLPRRMVGEGD